MKKVIECEPDLVCVKVEAGGRATSPANTPDASHAGCPTGCLARETELKASTYNLCSKSLVGLDGRESPPGAQREPRGAL